MKKRICRHCHKPLHDKRPVCQSCKNDKRQHELAADRHAWRKWGITLERLSDR